ncbi:MFS transporter [Micromonospora sp. HNM0581]|uniref:MFS transporter n=1 Tax=Micromonospora sp. HNM0581 TaxID=2716341 RepID=UPI00146DFE61|nr:MFS transporter [Micromonospora sp. HNM0581]NLU77945.1 MFS transporter [Micromonospora sp. HNM0581]
MTYLAMLRLPAVTRLLCAAVVGRLPTSMVALALTLTLRESGIGYRFIGLALAVLTVSQAVGGPALSRLIDRRGQTTVLSVSAPVSSLSIIAVAAAPDNRAVVLIGVALCGLATPPLEPCLRALWPGLVGEKNLQRAYSLDSVGQEVIFVTGPLLIALTVAVASPVVALVLTGVLCLAGTAVFASSPPSRQWRGAASNAGLLGPLRSPLLVLMLVGIAATVIPIGAVSIILVSYAEQTEVWGGASVLLGISAFGAFIGALINGRIAWKTPAATRIVVISACLGTAYLLVGTLAPVWMMAVIVFVAGFFLPPLLVIAFTLTDELAPTGTIVEAFAWLVTLFAVGSGIGAAVAGAVRDTAGTRAAALTVGGLAFLGVAVIAVFWIAHTSRVKVTVS